jgi:uncharacterized protein
MRAATVVLAAAALGLTGCGPLPGDGTPSPARGRPAAASIAHLPASSPLRSSSMVPSDMWLRHWVMTGSQDSLTQVLDGRRSSLRPGDDVHRMLQHALALHQAGQYEASNGLFEQAERAIEDRYARSVTQTGLSFVTSDAAIDYVPSRAERSMIPYYRMSNYLRLGDVGSALVEARKASATMAYLDSADGDACRSSTFLKYMTGLVYEAGGEYNDAVVSLRQAEQGYTACEGTYGLSVPPGFGADLARIARRAGLSDVAAEAERRYGVEPAADGEGMGEVLVFVENGFVAHRAEQDLFFPIFSHEVAGVNIKDPLAVLATAGLLTGRIVNNLVERDLWGASFDDLPEVQVAQALDGAYIMKLSWPSYRLESSGAARVRVAAGGRAAEARAVQDLSGEVVRDFEAVRLGVLARTVGRGVVRYVGAQEIERRAEEKNPLLGLLAGAAANIGANAMERADTRSWSLLPDQIAVARVRLPAGAHDVQLQVVGADGHVVRTETVGPVQVQAGRVTLASHRVWGDERGDRGRLARAVQGVSYADVPEGVTLPEPTARVAAAPAPSPNPAPAAAAAPVATPAPAPAPQASAAVIAQAIAEASPGAQPAPVPPAGGAVSVPEMVAPQGYHMVAGKVLSGEGVGFEYERAYHGAGAIGLVGSMYYHDFDAEIMTLGVRFRFYRGHPYRGFNGSILLGVTSICDFYCWGYDAGIELGSATGADFGYSLALGPVTVRAAVGAQLLIPLWEEELAGAELYDRGEIRFSPMAEVGLGWVLRR